MDIIVFQGPTSSGTGAKGDACGTALKHLSTIMMVTGAVRWISGMGQGDITIDSNSQVNDVLAQAEMLVANDPAGSMSQRLHIRRLHGYHRMVIIPIGWLYAVPFAALRSEDGYLLDSWQIATEPGVSILN